MVDQLRQRQRRISGGLRRLGSRAVLRSGPRARLLPRPGARGPKGRKAEHLRRNFSFREGPNLEARGCAKMSTRDFRSAPRLVAQRFRARGFLLLPNSAAIPSLAASFIPRVGAGQDLLPDADPEFWRR